MVGASVMAQLGVEVDYKGENRKELGLYGVAVNNPIAKKREINIGGKPVEPGIDANLEVFAGASAQISLEGAIEWMKPVLTTELKGEYKPFAIAKDGVAALAGVGVEGMLEVSYAAGRFRLKMRAGLCLGIGAKGDIELSVDAYYIVEFITWIFYQLYHANFQKLELITEEAYQTLTRIHVMAIQGFKSLSETVELEFEILRDEFNKLTEAYEKEENRVQLMKKVLSNPPMLQYATPEAKGIMLYTLTRHWKWSDGIDPRNHSDFRYYGERKDAIKQILRWSHTKRDFNNIIQHMNATGTKDTGETPAKNLALLMDFLSARPAKELRGPAPDGEEIDDFYHRLQARLKLEPTPGYAVAQVDTFEYSQQIALAKAHPIYTDLAATSMA